jgi:hypothetical protein
METLTIKIKNNKALNLIHELEVLNLIQVIATTSNKRSVSKLSATLSGSISEEEANNMHNELEKMRNEWERNT